MRYASDLDRFERFVTHAQGDHWIFTGSLNPKGYGRFWFSGRSREAHIVSYLLLVGEIPLGLQIDHLCRIRNCVNPGHLEPVAPLENFLRGNGRFGPGEFERCRSGKHLMAETRRYYGRDRQAKCYGCIKDRRKAKGR